MMEHSDRVPLHIETCVLGQAAIHVSTISRATTAVHTVSTMPSKLLISTPHWKIPDMDM